MKSKRLLTIATIITITAFFVGCAGQDTATDSVEDENALSDDEVIESIDEGEADDNNDEIEKSPDLSEDEALEDNDMPEAEEFSPGANPFQAFNRARENNFPIVLKFYSDT